MGSNGKHDDQSIWGTLTSLSSEDPQYHRVRFADIGQQWIPAKFCGVLSKIPSVRTSAKSLDRFLVGGRPPPGHFCMVGWGQFTVFTSIIVTGMWPVGTRLRCANSNENFGSFGSAHQEKPRILKIENIYKILIIYMAGFIYWVYLTWSRMIQKIYYNVQKLFYYYFGW